jgi:hypothetical protein
MRAASQSFRIRPASRTCGRSIAPRHKKPGRIATPVAAAGASGRHSIVPHPRPATASSGAVPDPGATGLLTPDLVVLLNFVSRYVTSGERLRQEEDVTRNRTAGLVICGRHSGSSRSRCSNAAHGLAWTGPR